MYNRMLADGLILFHLAFILFALLGGLIALRWTWVVALHLPAAAWGVLVEVNDWMCPLTDYEVRLRQRGGGPGYQGDFINHYLSTIIYPDWAANPHARFAVGIVFLALNLAIYGWIARRLLPRLTSCWSSAAEENGPRQETEAEANDLSGLP